MASFDGNGLVIDRLADVRTKIENDLKEVYGAAINLTETSPFGVLVGVMAERYASLWEMLEAVYEASFPNTSFGIYLDELVAFNGILREAGSVSSVLLTFTRSNDNTDGDVIIPQGTEVTAENSNVIWTTQTEATILNNSATTTVSAIANEVGEIGAVEGSLIVLVISVPNVASVTNGTNATVGSEEETDTALKLRRQSQLGAPGTATATGIVSALQLLEEVRQATIIVNDTDSTDSGGRPPHSFETFVSLDAAFNLGQEMTLVFQSTLVYDIDFVTGNSIVCNLDGNPIAGSPVAFISDTDTTLQAIATAYQNESEVAAATIDIVRREIRLERSGAAFVAATVVTGGASQAVSTFNTAGFIAGCTIDGTIDAVVLAANPMDFLTDQVTTLGVIAAGFEADSSIFSAEVVGGDTINLVGSTDTDVVLDAVVTYTVNPGATDQATFSSTAPAGEALGVIAQSLWDSKAAGIQTHGDFQATAVDLEGDFHTLFFSSISDVEIFPQVTLVTIVGEYDSAVAEPAIQEALSVYATANYIPGVDVLTFQLEAAISNLGLEGIENVTVGVSKTGGGPFVSPKIDIAISEFATIDSTDVTFGP